MLRFQNDAPCKLHAILKFQQDLAQTTVNCNMFVTETFCSKCKTKFIEAKGEAA